MIENPIIDSEYMNSGENDYLEYCEGCQGEIYFGEHYYDLDGDFIHCETQCIKQFIENYSIKKVAGE
ncbi:hypothetical protein ACWKTL_28935 [Bacillus toyonensis]|uniref:hypothetical protein n=1 Tax=Bacillus toyonensis TaxID=155322 RepID=UPI000B44647B|nr:hypothetical protein [Bacillus toyonensis]MCA1046939.1 hypothetical protein [Bacillus toyonensis]MDO8161654.1 hypothetical protein [Bacillus toyonensis]MED3201643.1 hypothetical protein [Bacillus toyonensis]OTX13876.1 hypothetical protein BK712_01295 [Bacillus thuringiensis serovar seoulensis]